MAKSLGMGLSALLGEDIAETALDSGAATKAGAPAGEGGTKTIAIGDLYPGKYQPRQAFGDDDLRNLADSIREKGVLQPLLVRPHPEHVDQYEIIAGERRWRAAQLAQIHDVPVIIRDFDDQETLEVALIENLQRQDLSPLEEADGYQRLMDEFSHTQEVLSKALGKSRSHVANMLRLLTLPDSVKDLLNDAKLSAGHARALIGHPRASELAAEVVKKALNVRQTETLVKDYGQSDPANPANLSKKAGSGSSSAVKDADTLALENDMGNALGLKVDIRDAGGKGQLVIHYETLEQLDGLLAKLTPSAN